MKLLILLTITLTINVSLVYKNSNSENIFDSTEIFQTIDNEVTSFYKQSIQLVNQIKNNLVVRLSDYSQLLVATFSGNNMNTINTNHLYSIDISTENNSTPQSFGDSDTVIIIETNPCFM